MAMQVPKVRQPHPDIGCWWTLYDYGLDKVKTWDKDYEHPYPGEDHVCNINLYSDMSRMLFVTGVAEQA